MITVLSFFVLVVQSDAINIDITGNYFFSQHYLTRNYSVHTLDDVELLIDHVLNIYNNAGFPFCEIRPQITQETGFITRITLHIQEHDRITIAEHLFLPDKNTDPGVISRYTRPERDVYFSTKEVSRIRQRLLHTNAFETIEETIVYRDDAYYMLWRLTEKQTDFLSAYGSVSEGNYIFSLMLNSVNLLGTLRQLGFVYEYEKLFTITAIEPILLAPAIVQGNLALWSYDTIQLFELNGSITAPVFAWLDLAIMTGIERASYSDSLVAPQIHNIFGGGGTFHTTHTWFATEHTCMFDYLVRDNDRWRLKYDGALALYDFSIRPHGRYVTTDSIQFFDYYRLGGAKSLRGYFEEEFTTTRAFWVNLEYKRLFIFPLLDVGYMNDDLIYSYGFGIDARSAFANASLAIAWPEHGSWRDGVLHLTFETGL